MRTVVLVLVAACGLCSANSVDVDMENKCGHAVNLVECYATAGAFNPLPKQQSLPPTPVTWRWESATDVDVIGNCNFWVGPASLGLKLNVNWTMTAAGTNTYAASVPPPLNLAYEGTQGTTATYSLILAQYC
eukprot:TRINITY_DN2775_c0_g1_i2.p1 TRINITY_DN2775_c0_g1~~TRINITY_DN2775_c0_g1_i2.p1  ORF type:complete len:132 (+),score=28.96 TRINITY_DN2775_c0_g1_i2:73-468(+)